MGKLTKNELIDILTEMEFENISGLSYNELYQIYKNEIENEEEGKENIEEDNEKGIKPLEEDNIEETEDSSKGSESLEQESSTTELEETKQESSTTELKKVKKEVSLKEKLNGLSNAQRRMYEKTGVIPN